MTKTIILQRTSESDEGTLGNLLVACPKTDNQMSWSTLELPWHDNQPYISRIPAGEYQGLRYESHRFGYSLRLVDVPGRSAILIHRGNFAGDQAKGWVSHSRGCILLGTRHGTIVNRRGSSQRAVYSSRVAVGEFRRWLESLKDEEPTVIIRDIHPEE